VNADWNIFRKPKTSRKRGEEGVIAFLEFHKKEKTFSPGDVLLSDHENAFDTPNVRAILEDMGVRKMNFPNGLGHLTDPCDNDFHSEEKARYHSIIAGLDLSTLTLKQKVEAIHGAYFGGSEASITNYFHHCGLLGSERPEEVAKKLLGEGIYASPKFQELHESQLEAYRNWRLDDSSSSESSLEFDFPECVESPEVYKSLPAPSEHLQPREKSNFVYSSSTDGR
jgi:hypothetical protein